MLQQQQAIINQMMHRSEQYGFMAIIIWLVLAGISGWVVYMFYRCQRDAADELQKIRIICEFMSARQVSSIKKAELFATTKENPIAADQDKYKPKG